MLSEARHSQSIGVLATALALLLGLSVAGGCASGGDEGATASGSGTSAGSDEAYPNLGDVPDRPATMTEEQRRRLEQGLVADSQGRAYSEEVIAFQSDPAEALPAPMETGAGGAPTSTLGDVKMPGAVSPPFSSVPDTPPAAPAAASTGAATAATAAAATSAAASVSTAPSAPTAISAPPAATTSSVSAAAAAAQATPPNIPVPPDDPMARATAPPFSGATASPQPVASVPPTAPVPPTPLASVPPTPSVPSPAAAYAPSTPSYTPVPSAPTALSGDPSTSNLNRAQLDSLQPTPPPFSGSTGATPGSYAPTPLTGTAATTTAPTAVTSAYAPTLATPAYAPAAPAAATLADVPPSATSAYAPPPAVPAEAPPVGVREVFEARLQDTLPSEPLADLPPTGDLVGDEPLTTVVVSSSGVATFEELPVDVPVLEREPVAAAVPGAQRRSLARSAVPSNSVKVATILFGDGSSDLRDREREIVREVYERYLASGRKVRVVGHSSSRTRNMDPVRHRMVNFGLSAERANAVAIELQRLGVPSEQITVVAAADDMPMYYEVMPSGEAGNRRTEIYLD